MRSSLLALNPSRSGPGDGRAALAGLYRAIPGLAAVSHRDAAEADAGPPLTLDGGELLGWGDR